MKKLLLFLFLLPVVHLAFAQCPVDSILRVRYDRDVKDLALRRIFAFNHPDQHLVEIPQRWQDTIWTGLAAIYSKTAIAERDTVFNIYCIHHDSPNFAAISRGLYLEIVSPWSFDPQDFSIHTSNPALDALLQQYNVVYESTFPGSNTIRVATVHPLNTIALADSLELFPEITSVEQVSYVGDGNRIMYQMDGNKQLFDFRLGWGDCQAGCINRRIWHFQVTDNCNAVYLGKTDQFGGGYAFPQPVNCFLSTAVDAPSVPANVQITPNPFQDVLQISIATPEPAFLRLLDLSGRVVLESNFTETFTLDTSHLPPGIYLATVFKEGVQSVYKLVKL